MSRETYTYFIVHKPEKRQNEVNPNQISKSTMCYLCVFPLSRSTFTVYFDQYVKQTVRTSSILVWNKTGEKNQLSDLH